MQRLRLMGCSFYAEDSGARLSNGPARRRRAEAGLPAPASTVGESDHLSTMLHFTLRALNISFPATLNRSCSFLLLCCAFFRDRLQQRSLGSEKICSTELDSVYSGP